MKKVHYSLVGLGTKYIYVTADGLYVKDAWRTKGELLESYVPGNRLVWVEG